MPRLLAFMLTAAFGTAVLGQEQSFDVASVRRSQNRAATDVVFLPGGQFRAANATVLELILAGYDAASFRIAGGPEWIRSEQYDVHTRAGADTTIEETRAMLRKLLEERFRLRTRIVRREVPIYRLSLSRQDGRLGPGLRPSALGSCVDRGPQPINVAPGAPPSCGRLLTNAGRMFGWRLPIDMLAARLERLADRPVIDGTELTGMYDVDLAWAAELASNNSDSPGLFTAVREQLGLKLDATTGTTEILVVDSVERPTVN